MKRTKKTREAIAITPLGVSQLNSLAILGVDPRRYLELLRANRDVPRARVGKLIVVEVADARALLRRLAAATEPEADEDEDGEWAPDAILERVGVRVAGARR